MSPCLADRKPIVPTLFEGLVSISGRHSRAQFDNPTTQPMPLPSWTDCAPLRCIKTRCDATKSAEMRMITSHCTTDMGWLRLVGSIKF